MDMSIPRWTCFDGDIVRRGRRVHCTQVSITAHIIIARTCNCAPPAAAPPIMSSSASSSALSNSLASFTSSSNAVWRVLVFTCGIQQHEVVYIYINFQNLNGRSQQSAGRDSGPTTPSGGGGGCKRLTPLYVEKGHVQAVKRLVELSAGIQDEC